MPQIYVHMSGRDLDRPILRLYGFEEEEAEKMKPELKPAVCWKCGSLNVADASVCSSCGSFLNLEATIRADEERKKRFEEITAKLEEERKLRLEYEKRLVRVERILDKFLKLQQLKEEVML